MILHTHMFHLQIWLFRALKTLKRSFFFKIVFFFLSAICVYLADHSGCHHSHSCQSHQGCSSSWGCTSPQLSWWHEQTLSPGLLRWDITSKLFFIFVLPVLKFKDCAFWPYASLNEWIPVSLHFFQWNINYIIFFVLGILRHLFIEWNSEE